MSGNGENVFVTGAGGFIGRHVLGELTGAGYSCSAPSRSNCDLTNPGAVQSFCSSTPFTIVVHLAARIPQSGADLPEDMFRQNLFATNNLLQRLFPKTYLVYTSTLDVYGEPLSLPIRETSPTDPLTHYAIAKLATEKLIQSHCLSHGIDHCVLRLSHVYGAGDRPIKLIPKTIQRVLSGQAPEIFGDGSDLRDYVHVRDVARVITRAVQHKVTGIFNVASGHSCSVLDTIETILKAASSSLQPVLRPRAKPRVDFQFDISHLIQTLDFQPQEDFYRGIQEIIANQLGSASHEKK